MIFVWDNTWDLFGLGRKGAGCSSGCEEGNHRRLGWTVSGQAIKTISFCGAPAGEGRDLHLPRGVLGPLVNYFILS